MRICQSKQAEVDAHAALATAGCAPHRCLHHWRVSMASMVYTHARAVRGGLGGLLARVLCEYDLLKSISQVPSQLACVVHELRLLQIRDQGDALFTALSWWEAAADVWADDVCDPNAMV